MGALVEEVEAKTATVFLCGGDTNDKELLTPPAGQTFRLTDITIANFFSTSTQARGISLSSQGSAKTPPVFLVPAGSTFTQSFVTPIPFAGPAPVHAHTDSCPDNAAVYVTISGTQQ